MNTCNWTVLNWLLTGPPTEEDYFPSRKITLNIGHWNVVIGSGALPI